MFLYKSFIAKIIGCPQGSHIEKNIGECYRWVYSDIADIRNFQPPAIRSDRANHFIHQQNCGKFATSFHIKLDGSLKHYKKLALQFGKEKAQSFFGTHIAKGSIIKKDGKSNTPCSTYTHFDIHIYTGNKLDGKTFTIVQEIK